MLRYLSIPLLCVCGAFVTAAPRDFGILGGKARVGTGGASLDAGHNPNLGLTSTWLGAPVAQDEFVDTSGDRALFLGLWEDLKALDVGNSVATHANTRFSGGTVTNWYVATTGSNTTGDGSSGNPWATIDYAYNQVPTTPSQSYQINVAAGTYLSGEITIAGKTIESPYYVRIVGTDYPILSYNQSFIDAVISEAEGLGYNFSVDTAYTEVNHYAPVVSIDDENIEFRGFRIIGARHLLPQYHYSESGIWMQHAALSSGESIILADLEISQVGHCAIKGGNNTGTIYVDGVFLHDNGLTGLDHHIYPTGSGFRIRRSLFVNADGLAINGNDSDRYDYVVSHNIFIGNQNGVSVAGKDWDVVHNIFFQNEYSGLFLYRAGVGGSSKNNVFYENNSTVTGARATIADVGGATGRYHFGFAWDYNYVESGSSVVTSTVDPTTIDAWVTDTAYAKGKVFRTSASRYYEVTVEGGNSGVSEPTAESAWTTGITDGANTIRYMGTSLSANTYTNTTTGDNSAGVVFVDVSNFDFTIKTGSSAASAGTDLGYAGGALPGVWSSTQ